MKIAIVARTWLLCLCLASISTALEAAQTEGPTEVPAVVAGVGGDACKIIVDGQGDESCWSGVKAYGLPHEFRPVPGHAPLVRTSYRILQDAEYLYVLVEADDPDPKAMRYGVSRRDKVANDQDNISIYIDPIGAKLFAQMFRVNPAGSMTDGTWNEASFTLSLDQDFEFDVGTKVTDKGWSAEYRIPFRALRYSSGNSDAPSAWTLLLVRSYPRDDRNLYATSPISPNSDCFLCKNLPIASLQPPDSPRFWQATPFVATRSSKRSDPVGHSDSNESEAGVDVKARIGASTFVDLTINPDFSQVELDTPQLSANARFGLFYREKRPFFLEGSDLFDAPLQLQYTRTIGEPRYGLRVTHRNESVEALAIFTKDRGGAAIMYPGQFSSYPIVRDSEADVALLRSRFAISQSLSVGAIASFREYDDGERNGVIASDLGWQVDPKNRLRFLVAGSDTRDDARFALEGRIGQEPRHGKAVVAEHSFYGEQWDSLVTLERVSNGFRSENGFIGQAGYGRAQAIAGYRFGSQGWFSEVKPYVTLESNDAMPGGNVYRYFRPALQLLGPSTGLFVEGHFDEVRADRGLAPHRLSQLLASVRWTPGPRLMTLQFDVETGRRLDYASDLDGPGLRVYSEAAYRLGSQTEIGIVLNHERIRHEEISELLSDTSFQIVVAHSLSSTSWLRLIAQSYRTARTDPSSLSESTSRRNVGSLVYSVVPWSGGNISLGLSAVSSDDGFGRHSSTKEAFLKVQHTFSSGF